MNGSNDRAAPGRWPPATVLLHWLSAAMIVGLVAVGFVMSDLSSDAPARRLLARAHTLGGVTLTLITVARGLARRRGPRPDPLPLSEPHRRFVALHHGLMYAALFGLGATGVLTAARSAWPDLLRGASRAPELHGLLSRAAHEALVFTLLGLLVLHVAGVLAQQARGARVLARMLPR